MDDLAAVLFDLDGTLCLPDQDLQDLWKRALAAAGADDVAPADLAAVDPDRLPTVETQLAFYEGLVEAAAADAGADLAPGTATAAAEGFLAAHDPRAVSFREGARGALAAAGRRYDVGLVTNGPRETQTAKLDALGVRDAFDATVYCDPSVGIDPKPDPTPLRMAVDELGVDPGAALHVGDYLDADVVGAHAAGLRSAWVPRERPTGDPEPAPTHTLDSMDAVADLLGT